MIALGGASISFILELELPRLDIVKLNSIIAGLQEVRDKKLEALIWPDSQRES